MDVFVQCTIVNTTPRNQVIYAERGENATLTCNYTGVKTSDIFTVDFYRRYTDAIIWSYRGNSTHGKIETNSVVYNIEAANGNNSLQFAYSIQFTGVSISRHDYYAYRCRINSRESQNIRVFVTGE